MMVMKIPPASSPSVTKVMKANRGKNTSLEIAVRKELRIRGYPGYRLHYSKAQGHPDICFPSRRVAIFVHGCFWHRCPKCNFGEPKSHNAYWSSKFRRNVERDSEKVKALEDDGWKVFVVWECEIREDVEESMNEIVRYLGIKRTINC